MPALKWVVLVLALFQGAWLVFDGTRALTRGDYFTPASGSRAGQLGPWSKVVAAIGFDPRGRFVKWAHVVLGSAWLIASVVFLARPASGFWALFCCSLASLWYLPVGTLMSLAVIALLLTLKTRLLS